MNRKVLVVGALMLGLGASAFALAGKEGSKDKGGHGGCPMHVAGAKVNVVKIESGVVIHVTGGDATSVAAIQAAAAGLSSAAPEGKAGCKHCAGHGGAKADAYACSMGDYSGPQTKDGRCPKCGMALSLKK